MCAKSPQGNPQEPRFAAAGLYSDSGRLFALAFSETSNDKGGFSVRLRRLGTVGILPFQLTCDCILSFSYDITMPYDYQLVFY